MKKLATFFTCFVCLILFIQNAESDMPLVNDSTTILGKRLEWYQDQKFGLLIEFGIWSAWGVSESWPLSTDNYDGNTKGALSITGKDTMKVRAYDTPNWDFKVDRYRKGYWDLAKIFLPRHFDSDEWADIAKEAGMKYICFYTKHHDGFNMYDTKLSDYKITSPDCPYSDHPNPDITDRLTTSFRKAGLGVGLIFSYSDWHSPFYWKPYTLSPNRHPNYDIEKEPERWQKFLDYYMGQIRELMTGYGKIDILWLDGGWDGTKALQTRKMMEMARGYQPELIIGRGGDPSDYQTPEKYIPGEPLDKPWETCESISDFWSWKPFDNYQSTKELIHRLVEIVSKGGNYLLNIPVMPDGKLVPPGVERIKQMGEWLKVNGDAIYGTRMYSRYMDGNIFYTKKENYVYAIYLEEGQKGKNQSDMPNLVNIKHVSPVRGSDIYLLGVEKPLKWKPSADGIKITVPGSVLKSLPCKYAYAFRIEASGK